MGRQREVATPCCLSLFYIAAKGLLFFETHKTFYLRCLFSYILIDFVKRENVLQFFSPTSTFM